MTDAKPATDMPTLETVVKSWREAPYKPATDNQIEAVRARLKIEEEYEMPSWRGNSVAILIARIDAERARVKALEDALRPFATRLIICSEGESVSLTYVVAEPPTQFGANQPITYHLMMAQNSYAQASLGALAVFVEQARAALKEPANG